MSGEKLNLKNTPTVSCICVTYNRTEYLDQLLYYFLSQDYENKELVIINDYKYIKYEYDDPRVKIINFDDRFDSLGEKRNYYLDICESDYISFWDDDDIFFSDFISTLVDDFNNYPEKEVLYQNLIYKIINDNEMFKFQYTSGFRLNFSLIKKIAYKNIRFKNINYGEDLNYMEKLNGMISENLNFKSAYQYLDNIKHTSNHYNLIDDMAAQKRIYEEMKGSEKNKIIKYKLKPSISPIYSELKEILYYE